MREEEGQGVELELLGFVGWGGRGGLLRLMLHDGRGEG